jgi:hypothetical protein
MRKMFGPQSVEVTRDWRKLHNDDSHSPSNIITVFTSDRMRWPEHVARTGQNRIILRFLAGKRICEWENDIKRYLKGRRTDGVSWINLAEDRDKSRAVVNAVMNSRVP